MKVYVVEGINPNYQIFATFEQAKDFAFNKANKRGCTNVWDERFNEFRKSCLNPNICGESHINIYEREVR